jgi:hypothetical protein
VGLNSHFGDRSPECALHGRIDRPEGGIILVDVLLVAVSLEPSDSAQERKVSTLVALLQKKVALTKVDGAATEKRGLRGGESKRRTLAPFGDSGSSLLQQMLP